jgi:hypothetical protein
MNKQDLINFAGCVQTFYLNTKVFDEPWTYGTIARAVLDLGDIEKKLHRLFEKECSDPRFNTSDAKAIEVLINKAQSIVARINPNILLVPNSDPRGYALKFKLPSGTTNSMDEYFVLGWI